MVLLALLNTASDAKAQSAPVAPGEVSLTPATVDSKTWDLARCLHSALQHSPQVQQQRLVVRAADEKQGEARSHLFPRVTWESQVYALSQLYDPIVVRSGAYGEMFVPSPGGSGYITSLPPRDVELLEAGPTEFASTRVRLQQPLFTWGRILLGMQLAELQHRFEQANLRATGYETAYLVRQLYLGLLLADASLELLSQMHGEMGRILDDTRALEAQGLVTPAAALEAAANLRQIEQEQARTEAEKVRAREALRLLVGASDDDAMAITGRLDSLEAITLTDENALIDSALAARPELESRTLQLHLAERQVALRQAEDLGRPTLALAAETGLRGDRLPLVRTNWTMAWDHYWMAGLVLQVPLFDGFEAHSKVNQAQTQRSQAELGVEQTRGLVRAEVRQRRAQVEARLREQVYARAREAERAEKYRVAEHSYASNTTNRSEFLGAHLEWSEARTSALLSTYLLHLAQLELDHASGRLPRSPGEVSR